LLSGDAPAGTAAIIDSASDGDTTTLFLVARNPENWTVDTVEFGGQRLAVREIDQTWATM
jgi:hypothetical protein